MRQVQLHRFSGISMAGFILFLGLPSQSIAYEIHSNQRIMEIRGAMEGDRFGRPLILLDIDEMAATISWQARIGWSFPRDRGPRFIFFAA